MGDGRPLKGGKRRPPKQSLPAESQWQTVSPIRPPPRSEFVRIPSEERGL